MGQLISVWEPFTSPFNRLTCECALHTHRLVVQTLLGIGLTTCPRLMVDISFSELQLSGFVDPAWIFWSNWISTVAQRRPPIVIDGVWLIMTLLLPLMMGRRTVARDENHHQGNGGKGEGVCLLWHFNFPMVPPASETESTERVIHLIIWRVGK